MPITRIGTYAQIQGTSFKLPCKVATTAAITLSGTQTIDGVAVVAGDRVLVKNQGTGADNGIYIAAAGAWSRAVDMSTDDDVYQGLQTYINSGTANGGKTFYLSTANPITLGVTSIAFTQTLILTTTGSSGSSTYSSNTLNVPTYTLAGLGGQPQLNGTGFVKASGTTISYDNSTYLTTSAASSTYQTILTNPVTGTGTINQIAYWTSASAIGALTTATYPSLTELSYVKGVTSAIQTQINGKQASSTNLTSLAGLSYTSASFVKMTAAGTFSLDTNTYLTTAVTSIAGTANQIAVSAATGAVTVSLTSAVTISGAMTASGFFESSDERLKDIIKRDGDVVYFKWKNSDGDDKTHIGYIAQEVQQTHPDQVGESDGHLTVNYIEMLVEKVRTLEKELANLKSKL